MNGSMSVSIWTHWPGSRPPRLTKESVGVVEEVYAPGPTLLPKGYV
jgi:hypothetical protein